MMHALKTYVFHIKYNVNALEQQLLRIDGQTRITSKKSDVPRARIM